MYCENCGERLETGALFCERCGARGVPPDPAPAPPAVRFPVPIAGASRVASAVGLSADELEAARIAEAPTGKIPGLAELELGARIDDAPAEPAPQSPPRFDSTRDRDPVSRPLEREPEVRAGTGFDRRMVLFGTAAVASALLLIVILYLLAFRARTGPVPTSAGSASPETAPSAQVDPVTDRIKEATFLNPAGATDDGGRKLGIAFSPDGALLVVSGGPEGGLELWERTASQEFRFRERRSGGARAGAMAFDPATRLVAWQESFPDSVVHVWDVGSGAERMKPEVPGTLEAMTLASGRLKLVASGALQIWDVGSSKLLSERRLAGWQPPSEDAGTTVFSPDGEILARSQPDGILVWDLSPAERGPARLVAGGGRRTVLAFRADNRSLAVAEGRELAVWDVITGQRARTLLGHTQDVTAADFSPDGRLLVSVAPGEAVLWDLVNGRVADRAVAPTERYRSVAFDPLQRWIASGTSGRVRLWRLS